MFRKFILFILLTPIFYLLTPIVHAEENFDTSYDITYAILENAETKATLNVQLKNTTSQYYASSYKLQVGFETLNNLKVSDPDGAITPKITKTEEGTMIDVPFNKRVVGLGNVLSFTITFNTPDVAQKNGQIYEINIPGISNAGDFSAFTVDVDVPKSFGEATFIKPSSSGSDLHFTKDELGKSGISLAFGKAQVYDFALTYHLRNTNVYPIETFIAIPPSTNYQEIALEDLTPKPIRIKKDQDGNWLASYRLSPSQKQDVVVTGKAELFLTPKKEPLSDVMRKKYLEEKPYWQTSNPKIKKLAADLKTPEAIYEYVVKTLSYDFDRVTNSLPRLGAVSVLNKPDSAVCLEFTDLFIALARAAGIPAREINGYAYTENSKQRPLSLVKDILHAWPEYYDGETWVMVDPTWGNTTGGVDYFHTFDFDHLAFVIKGASSTTPVPAGGYKYEGDENKKDVNISFSPTSFDFKPTLSVISQFPKKSLAGFPIKGTITVKNTSKVESPKQMLQVDSNTLSPRSQQVVLEALPPYGEQSVLMSFDKLSFLTNKSHNFTIQVASNTLRQTIHIYPIFFSIWMIGGVLIVISGVTLFIITRKARRISLPGQKQEDPLRGQGEQP